MSVKVSVVIPVFNPGPYMEPCLESLLSQSMRSEELELIFVDDASYDDSFERLQRLEAEHPHVRAITIARSGWPGKPRNVGTDAASGEYVMYVDQDDRLDPESLERMYELGSANDADIVLGKVTSDFRGVHQYLYREQRARCTVYDARLINSQTPHKMLRRQFLIDQDIRFPEGRRRLEDQLFITRAYFAAQSCSIVSDYVCYRYLRRPDGGNAGSWRIDPEAYFANLREVLDVVDAAVEPGEVRDHFYRRFLRVEMLGKLSGRRVRAYPPDIGNGWLAQIRSLMDDRFPLTVDEGLPALARTRAHLARHASFAVLQDLTGRTRNIEPVVSVDAVHAADQGSVDLDLEGAYLNDGEPFLLEPDGSGGWLLPVAVVGDLTPDLRRVEDAAEMTADAVVVDREQGDEWFLTPPLSIGVEATPDGGVVRVRGSIRLDPATAAGGRPLSAGTHDLMLRVEAIGLSRLRRLTAPALHQSGAGSDARSVVVAPGTMLKVSRSHRLSLVVGVSGKIVRGQVGPVTADWSQERLMIRLSGRWWATPSLRVALTSVTGQQSEVRVRASHDDPLLWVGAPAALGAGRYTVRVQLKAAGWITVEDPLVVPRTFRRLTGVVRERVRAALGSVRQRLRPSS